MNKPMFIALEGGEGSGKSSVIKALADEFADVIRLTREPGGSKYAELIREAAIKNPLAKTAPPEATLCLMFAARFDHLANVIVPSLESGTTVITDRFDASSYAYQIGAQQLGDLGDLFWFMRKKLSRTPDLYIFLDVEPDTGLRRARSRNAAEASGGTTYDHFDDRDIAFHKKVRDGYMSFFEKSGVAHKVIDANQPKESVIQNVLDTVRAALTAHAS